MSGLSAIQPTTAQATPLEQMRIMAEQAGRARGYDLSDAVMGQLDRQVQALAGWRHRNGGAS